jgi:hypothetical protein
MILRELHTTEIDCWIKEHHYLHSTPAGAVQRLSVLNYRQISRNARMNGVYGCWMVGCVRLNVV